MMIRLWNAEKPSSYKASDSSSQGLFVMSSRLGLQSLLGGASGPQGGFWKKKEQAFSNFVGIRTKVKLGLRRVGVLEKNE